jgi:hypothetical protein
MYLAFGNEQKHISIFAPPGWGAAAPLIPGGGFGGRQTPNPGGLGGGSPLVKEKQ